MSIVLDNYFFDVTQFLGAKAQIAGKSNGLKPEFA
jgi:hypothetical protein